MPKQRSAERERAELQTIDRVDGEFERLGTSLRALDLSALLSSDLRASEWNEAEATLASFGISESAGGVNPGDRRALFCLLRGLGAASVLEIGTHVGSSTVAMVAALALGSRLGERLSPRLVTVDIVDVNDERTAPWVQLGSTHSPRQMIAGMGAEGWVRFVNAPSLEFLHGNSELFDVVFLDGSHAAKAVYREIAAALGSLEAGGFIVLHDFFPGGMPLWSNGIVIPGPWLAVERLLSEGAPIDVLPLADLPWKTKQGSRMSSLALLVGARG
jgi:predicted O-methyltransferase YrrM